METIIYYGGFFLPDRSASANRVVSNGKLFDSLGYETVFLGADYETEFTGVKKLSEEMYSEAHPSNSVEWLKNLLFFENLKAVAESFQNVKLVVLYNVPFATVYLAKKYFSPRGIEVAYDCTEWSQFTEGSFLKRAFKYIDEYFIRNFAHKVADKMIVISKKMEQAYSSDKKLLRLPPLVDIKDEIWHQAVNEGRESFSFCFAGFTGGNKDCLDKVVDAFLQLNEKNAELNIAGLTEEDFFREYPKKAFESHKLKGINFLGVLTHRQAVEKILNGDCYIFIRESNRRNNAGFPTKFSESFTCGVPIIATDISDIKDYMNSCEGNILLKGIEVADITAAMKQACENRQNARTRELKKEFHYEEYKKEAEAWLL